jgi:hypothetical protein
MGEFFSEAKCNRNEGICRGDTPGLTMDSGLSDRLELSFIITEARE